MPDQQREGGADRRPAVVAYDGSPEAQAAVRTAATLFTERPLVVLTVWESAIGAAMTSVSDDYGIGYVAPGMDDVAALDRAGRDHATDMATQGARLAEELGARAEPVAVQDAADVPKTIVAVAKERDASVLVVGSRGLGRVKSSVFGSTSRSLLNAGALPVLVVRAP